MKLENPFGKVRLIYILEFDNSLSAPIVIENLVRVCKFLVHRVIHNFLYCVGDTLKWLCPKEGGQVTNRCYFQSIHEFQVVGHKFVKFNNQGGFVKEGYFASKWPDLGTNRFKEGGDDTTRPRERLLFQPTSEAHRVCKLYVAQFYFVELQLACFQLFTTSMSSN